MPYLSQWIPNIYFFGYLFIYKYIFEHLLSWQDLWHTQNWKVSSPWLETTCFVSHFPILRVSPFCLFYTIANLIILACLFVGVTPLVKCQFLEGRDCTTFTSLQILAEGLCLNGFYSWENNTLNLNDVAKIPSMLIVLSFL